ncbi:Ribokinase-like protein [Stereum hirsutum FP-91666 SS1]|uniref:Ribokinase-like protein n=1 Tax=Stereum hirsutum (strain FP-91666) TaxID=721885 RepID=UPI000444A684|nr:Ribokinase-like protein [Stereum hirsutum FP-91666 SS1]EIM81412.1 Ribokinase-like protein [Stereum hirsutum FP-91666 SS1]
MASQSPSTRPVLASLGTLLVDCFSWTDPSTLKPLPDKPPIQRLGGGGLYALVGARIWLGPEALRILVDGGTDSHADGEKSLRDDEGKSEGDGFPTELKIQLDELGEYMWVWKKGRTLKASIEYCGDERTFTYLSIPPIRRASDLLSTALYGAEYVHVVASPSDCLQLVDDLEQLQIESGAAPSEIWRPKIVYEPHPKNCRGEELGALREVLSKVHVLSPNHEELAAFLSDSIQVSASPNSSTTTLSKKIESHIRSLMPSRGIGPDGNGAIVVRSGAMGACVGRRKHRNVAGNDEQYSSEEGLEIDWVPAYWTQEEKGEVRDVTGAGNSFLGGLVAGLHFTKDDAREATLYASVSASYVVQQFGLPILSSGTQEDGGEHGDVRVKNEVWNRESPWMRLERLKARMMDIS